MLVKLKDAFFPLVDKLIAQAGSTEFIQTFKDAAMFTKQFSNEAFTGGNMDYVRNTFVDVLNRASTSEWNSIAEKFPSLSVDVNSSTNGILAAPNSVRTCSGAR